MCYHASHIWKLTEKLSRKRFQHIYLLINKDLCVCYKKSSCLPPIISNKEISICLPKFRVSIWSLELSNVYKSAIRRSFKWNQIGQFNWRLIWLSLLYRTQSWETDDKKTEIWKTCVYKFKSNIKENNYVMVQGRDSFLATV